MSVKRGSTVFVLMHGLCKFSAADIHVDSYRHVIDLQVTRQINFSPSLNIKNLEGYC